jgi:hypothetical protein
MRPWQRNPLLQASDRVRFGLHVLLVALIALTAPLAAAVGAAIYTSVVAESVAGTVGVRTVSATLDADASPVMLRANSAVVQAHWSADGRTVTGRVQARAGARQGDRVQVRVHADGTVAAPGPSRQEAMPEAVIVGLMALVAADAAMLVLWRGACLALDRHRHGRWDHEWALVDPAASRRS